MLRLPFTGDEAKKLNQEILKHYILLLPLWNWQNGRTLFNIWSPISQGEFQHNLWNIKDEDLSGRWDWAALRKK
jgi:ribonucleoside-diphosphate reductase alpha chain